MSKAISARIRERIEELEAEKAEELEQVAAGYDALISELKGVLGEEGDAGEESTPGKANAPAGQRKPTPASKNGSAKPKATPATNGNGNGNGNGKTPGGKWPLILARILADGPKRVGEIEKEAGAVAQTFNRHLRDNPWFERTDPENRLSPYQLSESGKAALAEHSEH